MPLFFMLSVNFCSSKNPARGERRQVLVQALKTTFLASSLQATKSLVGDLSLHKYYLECCVAGVGVGGIAGSIHNARGFWKALIGKPKVTLKY